MRFVTFALDHLIASGVERFVINTHHLSEQFADFFSDGSYRSKKIALIYEPNLLETGGGILNAAALFGPEPFLVYSGDILTDIHLGALTDFHFQSGSMLTLALPHTRLSTDLSFDATTNRVLDIRGQLGSGLSGSVGFAIDSVWNPEIVGQIPS